MSYALLIHDDPSVRAYVYLDGELVLDVSKRSADWQAAIAEVLGAADEVGETEGSVERCGEPPTSLDEWHGLAPVERFGEGSLSGIVDLFAIGVVLTLEWNADGVLGGDFFFPPDPPVIV